LSKPARQQLEGNQNLAALVHSEPGGLGRQLIGCGLFEHRQRHGSRHPRLRRQLSAGIPAPDDRAAAREVDRLVRGLVARRLGRSDGCRCVSDFLVTGGLRLSRLVRLFGGFGERGVGIGLGFLQGFVVGVVVESRLGSGSFIAGRFGGFGRGGHSLVERRKLCDRGAARGFGVGRRFHQRRVIDPRLPLDANRPLPFGRLFGRTEDECR